MEADARSAGHDKARLDAKGARRFVGRAMPKRMRRAEFAGCRGHRDTRHRRAQLGEDCDARAGQWRGSGACWLSVHAPVGAWGTDDARPGISFRGLMTAGFGGGSRHDSRAARRRQAADFADHRGNRLQEQPDQRCPDDTSHATQYSGPSNGKGLPTPSKRSYLLAGYTIYNPAPWPSPALPA